MVPVITDGVPIAGSPVATCEGATCSPLPVAVGTGLGAFTAGVGAPAIAVAVGWLPVSHAERIAPSKRIRIAIERNVVLLDEFKRE